MFKTIKKTFIKDYQKTDNPEVRYKYGTCAGIIGIIFNVISAGFKVAIGLICGSIAIIADAINNFTDAGSSVITVFGFKFAQKAPDKEHPFGHARYEYITGLIIAFLAFAIGAVLAYESVMKLIEQPIVGAQISGIGWYTYAVLVFAVFIKFMQMMLFRDFGKSISSEALIATAVDSRNDILSTGFTIISTIILHTTRINLDGCFGLVISAFIIISSIKMVKETVDPLLGAPPDKELVDKINTKLLSYEGICGIHDLVVHSYGAGNCFAIVHAEVSSNVDVMISHELIDKIERDFKNELGIILNIHMDPIDVDNPEVLRLAQIIRDTVGYNFKLSIHDFRVVFGINNTNLLFDVVIPFGSEYKLDQIIEKCREALRDEKVTYHFVVNVDREFS